MSLSYEPFPLLCLSNIGVCVYRCVQVCTGVCSGRKGACLLPPHTWSNHALDPDVLVCVDLVSWQPDGPSCLSVCRLYRLLPDGSKYTELDFVILMFKMWWVSPLTTKKFFLFVSTCNNLQPSGSSHDDQASRNHCFKCMTLVIFQKLDTSVGFIDA